MEQHTVNALAVALGLAIKHGIFIPWQHFRLGRHLSLPSLEGLESLSLLGESSVDGRYNVVDSSETKSVAALLELGQPPGDLPKKTTGQRIRDAECAEHRGIAADLETQSEEGFRDCRMNVNFFPAAGGCGSRAGLSAEQTVGFIKRNIVRPER